MVPTLLPANVMVMEWPGMKLLPATVTLVPTGPELGLKLRAGVVTVNVAVGECVPSLAVTVRPPAGALGTVKEQLKLPLEPEVQEPGVVVTLLPANVMVMEWPGMKLLPATVTLVPTGPELGLKVIADVVTVNVAVGAFVPSLAVTV